MNEIKPGDTYTKNGFDFHVQYVENGKVYGVKYHSEERAVENFGDCKKGYEMLKLPVDELLAYNAELIREAK